MQYKTRIFRLFCKKNECGVKEMSRIMVFCVFLKNKVISSGVVMEGGVGDFTWSLCFLGEEFIKSEKPPAVEGRELL